PSGGLPRGAPGSGTDLSVQAAAMLSAAEKTSHPTSVRPISAALPARRSPVAPGRPGATGAARRNSVGLVPGDRGHVALHPQQRHHRRLSQQNGADQPPSLRLPQFSKLQTASEGAMFLEIS